MQKQVVMVITFHASCKFYPGNTLDKEDCFYLRKTHLAISCHVWEKATLDNVTNRFSRIHVLKHLMKTDDKKKNIKVTCLS